jgi:hypothetical protein
MKCVVAVFCRALHYRRSCTYTARYHCLPRTKRIANARDGTREKNVYYVFFLGSCKDILREEAALARADGFLKRYLETGRVCLEMFNTPRNPRCCCVLLLLSTDFLSDVCAAEKRADG